MVTFPLSREREAERAKRVRGESRNRNVTFYLSYYLTQQNRLKKRLSDLLVGVEQKATSERSVVCRISDTA